jgi:hypothetical protein
MSRADISSPMPAPISDPARRAEMDLLYKRQAEAFSRWQDATREANSRLAFFEKIEMGERAAAARHAREARAERAAARAARAAGGGCGDCIAGAACDRSLL